MKPTQVKEALKTTIKAGLPCFIWGSPGVGKSEVVKQTAQELDLDLIDIRAVLLDPVDLRGLPEVRDGLSFWAPPSFWPRNGKGVLFLDELNAAPPLVQAACYQLVLDRKIGEYCLPDGWIVIAAGNKETDRAVTSRMSSALASRFIHVLSFDVDMNDWITWGLANNIRPEILGFIRFRPGLLMAFDPQKNDKAFPCPRTWAYASRILDAKPNQGIEFELLSGIIGQGAATEFIGFLRIYRDLPDPDLILKDPAKGEIPDDPAILYALCGALSRRVTLKNSAQLIAYANRLPDEFSVLLVTDIGRINADILKTKAFVSWGIKHQDILL